MANLGLSCSPSVTNPSSCRLAEQPAASALATDIAEKSVVRPTEFRITICSHASWMWNRPRPGTSQQTRNSPVHRPSAGERSPRPGDRLRDLADLGAHELA